MPLIDEITFDDHTGETRKLLRLEPNEDQKKMRAARTNIQTLRTEQGLPPLIPQSEWVPVDRSVQLGPRFVLDQKQNGSCVGFSNAAAEMKSRFFASGDYQLFSGAFTYALIDGGHDNGAVITDAMQTSLTVGNVLKSLFDIKDLVFSGRPQHIDPAIISSAAQFKATDCVTVGTFAEFATALLMGMVVQGPWQVGAHTENFDADGVCGYDNGPGNHSSHWDSLIRLSSGEWILEGDNTWGAWGWKRNGRMRHRQKHIDGCASADDAFGHLSSMLPAPPLPA